VAVKPKKAVAKKSMEVEESSEEEVKP